MSPEQDDVDPVEELIERCLLRLPEEGSSVLEELCESNPEHADDLRWAIERLRGAGLVDPDTSTSEFPERLGDFRLIERLGGGSMGVVYLAEQESLGRRVALKLIRPEHVYFGGSRERFQREVEAVARLQHPGIVPVHTVGEEDGVPYFAMELVHGCSVAEALDSLSGRPPEQLTGHDLRQAVLRCSSADELEEGEGDELFQGPWITVCLRIALHAAQALDHAHGRGVLHRDVKASNLMLTPAGRVTVLDFGLARMEGSAEMTRTGTPLGSLAYMSPEQLEGRHAELGPAADVYSLGVVLYEMLTLNSPHRAESTEETCRRIFEGRPDSPRQHNRAVPVDVETACLVAMDPDFDRRYATAGEFARDLQNLLEYRPILARRPGVVLRMRRFAQRKPGASAAIVLGVLLFVAIPVGLYLLYAQERAARLEIDKEAKVAQKTTDFMVDLFDQATPARALGRDMRLSTLLDRGSETVETELRDLPAVRVRLLITFGKVYRNLAIYDKAERALAAAEKLVREGTVLSENDSYDLRYFRADLHAAKGEYRESVARFRELLADWRREHGPDGNTACCLWQLAGPLIALGEHEAAERSAREAVRMFRSLAPIEDGKLAHSLVSLSVVLMARDRHAEALPQLEEALKIQRRVFPNGAPAMISTLEPLTACLTALHRYDEALKTADESLAEVERFLRPGHPMVAVVLNAKAYALQEAGRSGEAEPLLREAIRVKENALDPDHPSLASSLNNLGFYLNNVGRPAEALPLLDRAHKIQIEAHAGDHETTATTLLNISQSHTQIGDFPRAEKHARESLRMYEALGLLDTQQAVRAQLGLSWVLMQLGRLDEAEPIVLQANTTSANRPSGRPDLAWGHQRLAFIALWRNQAAKGERHARKSLAILEECRPNGHLQHAYAYNLIGWACEKQGKMAEAVAGYTKSIEYFDRLFPKGHPEVAFPLNGLGVVLTEDRPAKAVPLLERSLKIRKKRLAAGSHWIRVTLRNLVGALKGARRFDEALPLCEESVDYARKLPAPSAELALGLHRLACCRMHLEKFEGGADAAEESLKLFELLYPKGHLWVARTRGLLGECELGRGRIAEAEEHLVAAHAYLARTRGKDDADTVKAAGRLARLNDKKD